jgi:glycosyltransferase involved in cell wall biosynthesis
MVFVGEAIPKVQRTLLCLTPILVLRMTGFSIIICTHNPNVELLGRLLNAILNFSEASPRHEVILVDNKSDQPLSEVNIVKEFLVAKSDVRILQEATPGLTAARICGMEEARYEWIVFFDDDNEPEADYLIVAAKIIDQFPQVGAWGPGNVEVEYTDVNTPEWLNNYKHVFQQRNTSQLSFDNIFWWQHCYPYGTGFLLKRKICLEYKRRVGQNIYSLSDRKGKTLSSGGDMQMIYTGLLMGYSIGVSPDIKLNHLINKTKANQRYIARLLYGSAASNLPAYYQCFPEKYNAISYPSSGIILKKLYYFFKVLLFKQGVREFYFQLSRYLGELEGLSLLEPTCRKPFFVKRLEQLLRIK